MSRSTFPLATRLFLLLFLASVRPATAQVTDLVRRVPDRPNTVMVLDVEKIFRSPLAEQERWADKLMQAFESGMIMVPPQASRFVLASQLDLDAMQPLWEVALLNVSEEVSIPEVAQQRGGDG